MRAIGNGNNILERIDDDRIKNDGFNGYMYIISISKIKFIYVIRNILDIMVFVFLKIKEFFLLLVIVDILKFIE